MSNKQSSTNSSSSKVSTSSSSDESCYLNGVKETEDSDQCAIKIQNSSNKEHVVTKEGELLPKTKAKLEEVIRSKGIIKFSVDVSAGSEVGDNFLGFIGKVVIKGVDELGKRTTWEWIVKTAPTQELYRNVLKVEILYAREVYVYEHIFPVFQQFQKDKSVLRPFNQHPPFIFSHLEPYSESFAMENMKSKGYVMRKRQETLDYNHVKLVMKAYAKMHAVSYALKDQKPELFDKLRANTKDSMTAAHSKELASDTMSTYLKNALETLDVDKDLDTYKKFEQLCDKFADLYYDVLDNPNEYAVIGHGDSWVNNMLWLYDDPMNPLIPKEVCLLDFQLCRYGSPAYDLSYFIFTCTDKALRDEHYDDMIKLYHYHLCEQLVEMGSDPERWLPFPRLQEELKRFSIVGLYYSVMVLSIITRDADEIPNLKDGDKDLEELKEKWGERSKHHEDYCRRVRGCLVDFAQKGYFDYYTD